MIVGDTSKARKGTATDRATDILVKSMPIMATRKRSGLSSGEGLIQAVRDAREEDVAVKKDKTGPQRFERQTVDAGEPDKRLFVVESEFGSVLQQSGRDGNILSAICAMRGTENPCACWHGATKILARSRTSRTMET